MAPIAPEYMTRRSRSSAFGGGNVLYFSAGSVFTNQNRLPGAPSPPIFPAARIAGERCSTVLRSGADNEETLMLTWSILFLIIAIVAAIFGFWAVAGAAAFVAKILFVVFLVLFLISMLARAMRGNRPPV